MLSSGQFYHIFCRSFAATVTANNNIASMRDRLAHNLQSMLHHHPASEDFRHS
jgi:hypothetical protein